MLTRGTPIQTPTLPSKPPTPPFEDALRNARQRRTESLGSSSTLREAVHQDKAPDAVTELAPDVVNERDARDGEIAHRVRPHESLFEIADLYDTPFNIVLDANDQFADPDRIHPGDVAFVPGADEATVSLHQSADAYMASRRSLASAQDSLGDPALRGVVRAELPALQQSATQRETELRNQVADRLAAAGGDGARPEETAREALQTLKAQLPDDPGVREVLDLGFDDALAGWRARGSTAAQLDPLTQRLDAVEAAQDDLQFVASVGSGGRIEIPALQRTLTDAREGLNAEIRDQLDATLEQAAQEVGKASGTTLTADELSPEQRELALTARATLMIEQGPQSETFRAAVDETLASMTVAPAVERVAATYERDGAAAAAQALRDQTADVSPAVAERIVSESLPTVEAIATDLDASLTSPDSPIAHDAIEGVYLDLAASVDRAERGAGGAQVVEDVATIMTEHLPVGRAMGDAPSYPVQPYLQAVQQSVVDSGGGLALATAAQLAESGKMDAASSLTGWVDAGLNDLSGQIDDALADLGESTEVTAQLRRDWSGVMDQERLDDATLEYVNENPDILEKFDQSYADIDRLGYAATRAGFALDRTLPRLDGLERTEGLRETHDTFFGGDTAMQAMGLSERSRDEVLFQATGPRNDDGSLVDRSRDSSVRAGRSLLKELGQLATRSSVSVAMLGDIGNGGGDRTLDVFSGRQSAQFDPNKVTPFAGSMNGLGALFNGYMAKSSLERIDFENNPDSLLEATKSVYYTIGTGKESAELLAAGAQTRFFRDWLSPTADSLSQSILSKAQRTGLAREPGWVKFSAFFGIGGGTLDGIYAGKSAAEGDFIAAGLYGLSSTGGFIAGASTFATSGWLASSAAGPIGIGVSTAATLGLYVYNDYKDKHRFEAPAESFLTHAGFSSDVAHELAQQGANGEVAGPGLGATAEHFRHPNDAPLFDDLTTLDPDVVKMLTEAAWTVQPDEAGDFALTADNDRTVWGPPAKDPQFGGEYLYDPENGRYRGGFGSQGERLEDPNPRSLTALRDYARSLTGGELLG